MSKTPVCRSKTPVCRSKRPTCKRKSGASRLACCEKGSKTSSKGCHKPLNPLEKSAQPNQSSGEWPKSWRANLNPRNEGKQALRRCFKWRSKACRRGYSRPRRRKSHSVSRLRTEIGRFQPCERKTKRCERSSRPKRSCERRSNSRWPRPSSCGCKARARAKQSGPKRSYRSSSERLSRLKIPNRALSLRSTTSNGS